MSFFTTLFGEPAETYIAKEFAVYKETVDELINGQDAILQSLGITPPQSNY